MAVIKEIYQALDAFAPFHTQMSFDNAGFLVGREDASVTGILVALDITLPVIREAKALGANLIVSHHPVIFHPAKAMVSGDPTGDLLLTLAEERIGAICAHTNLDMAVGGVNDALAQAVGLQNIQIFLPQSEPDGQGRPYGLGRVGELSTPVSAREFALCVKQTLGASSVRCADAGRAVQRVAVGGGACGEYLRQAYDQGCDLFLTADVKYNLFLEAKALGISLLDAGHFPTENVVLPSLSALLTGRFPTVPIHLTQVHQEVYFSL